MEFLEKLYEMENFGLYLFGVIGILIVLFMVVLIMGKKDQKKNKIEQKETNDVLPEKQMNSEEQAIENETFAFHDNNVEVPVEVHETKEPSALESQTPPQTFTTANNVLNDELFASVPKDTLQEPANEKTVIEPVVTEPVMPSPVAQVVEPINVDHPKEEVLEKKEQPVKEFDFDALASAISKELESIEKKEVKNVEEPKTLNTNFKTFEPASVAKEEGLEPKEEPIKPKPVMPTVFSSVYVNREKEVKEPVKEEPAKPSFDLPKMVDLPKKIDDNNN